MFLLTGDIQSLILRHNVPRRTFKVVLSLRHDRMSQLFFKLSLCLPDLLHYLLVLLFSTFLVRIFLLFEVEYSFRSLREIRHSLILLLSDFLLLFDDHLYFLQFLQNVRRHPFEFEGRDQCIRLNSFDFELSEL